jgi:hypothetical protein
MPKGSCKEFKQREAWLDFSLLWYPKISKAILNTAFTGLRSFVSKNNGKFE